MSHIAFVHLFLAALCRYAGPAPSKCGCKNHTMLSVNIISAITDSYDFNKVIAVGVLENKVPKGE